MNGLAGECDAAADPWQGPATRVRSRTPVVVGDDHPMYRRSLMAAVDDHPDLDLVGDAADGHQALARVRALEPDVALMDLRMPGLDGFEVLAGVQEAGQSSRVLFLSAFGDSATVHHALEARGLGLLVQGR